MKNNYKILLIVLLSSLALWSFMPHKKVSDPEKDKTLIDIITFVLEKGHYDPAVIDDKFSQGVYKEYIDALDPSRRFFTESDIVQFKKYENQIDDMIKNRDLSFFKLTYQRLQRRMVEAKVIYRTIADKPFDFSTDENINIDSENLPFAKDYNDLKTRWRLQIKLSTLFSVADKLQIEEDKVAKDPKYEAKTLKEIEIESREASLKSLNDYFEFIEDTEEKDWFVVYINAIVTQFDPHTFYFAPEEKEKFDITMSGKLEGIGARLQKKGDFTEVSELISGGPAWRSKQLEQGDLIIKVAQGSKEAVDVTGMRIDDVVKKIKGKRGTEVRLTVKKVDGSIKIVTLTRDIVELEETYAKSSIIEKNGKKVGIIYLPKFYIDFEDEQNRDSAKDVAIELENLKKAGVEGIIMDLRDNGGGSLKTAVDITGLFIKEGPVVQIKSAGKNKDILFDRDPKVQWDGPLVVMVNNFSASASEIFAAAIQDYKRGIIIGSKQSYGKGTVQNVIDLNQFVRNSTMGDFGALKTTTQKFYRITGGSTQLQGVTSDIALPDRYSYIKIGERDIPHAMVWDKIDPAPFETFKNVNNFETIKANSRKRLLENNQFKLIDQSAKWVNDRKDDNNVSLNLEKFRVKQKEIEVVAKKYKQINEYKNKLTFTNLEHDKILIAKDSTLEQKREDWHSIMEKDVYIEEAVNILGEMKKTQVPSSSKLLSVKTRKDKLIKN